MKELPTREQHIIQTENEKNPFDLIYKSTFDKYQRHIDELKIERNKRLLVIEERAIISGLPINPITKQAIITKFGE